MGSLNPKPYVEGSLVCSIPADACEARNFQVQVGNFLLTIDVGWMFVSDQDSALVYRAAFRPDEFQKRTLERLSVQGFMLHASPPTQRYGQNFLHLIEIMKSIIVARNNC